MTKQTINVGTSANDRKGDSLRAAFQKVNANFAELYTATSYTPAHPSDWTGTAPVTIQEALDRVATAIKAIDSTGP
jgi:chromosome segregation ATPase